jgi:hypothetical protein
MVMPRERPRIIQARNYKSFDLNAFSKDLEKLPWAIIESFSEPNDMWHTWKTLFNSVLDNHAPVRTKRGRNLDVHWITSDLKKLCFVGTISENELQKLSLILLGVNTVPCEIE